jgi:RNA polymerase sigma factor (sigma-70 family)
MSAHPAPLDPEELLAEIGWVRSLARQMTTDAHIAEDLAQDALLVALGGVRPDPRFGGTPAAPRHGSLRRWLATVVRNLWRTRRRGERRRAAREAVVARREFSPATVELIERAAMHRELVGALLRLDEPYRSTLLLRFLAGCTQREIAARTGVPVSTVGTRIADGLGRLRRKVGSRDRWLPSFVALLRTPPGAAGTAHLPGVLLVTLQAKLIVAAVSAIALYLLWQTVDPGAPDTHTTTAAATPVEVEPTVAASAAVERRVVTPPPPAAAPGFHDISAHAGIVIARVRGQVIDPAGIPVAEVEVWRTSPAGMVAETGAPVSARRLGHVTADQAGRFEIEGAAPFQLRVEDARFTTVCAGAVGGRTTQEIVVVVAPRISLGGVVVDASGSPIPDVRITFQAEVARAGLDLSMSRELTSEGRTDERGAFRLDDAGAVADAQLRFRADGFDQHSLTVPLGGDLGLCVVLKKTAASVHTITGRVVLADGSPAGGALVSTGVFASTADAQGAFAIDFEPWLRHRVDENAPTVVTAVRAGLLPAVRTLPSVRQARASGWPSDLVLQLTGAPRTIRGIVVDELGKAVPDALVEPADPTPFGIVPDASQPGFVGMPRSQEQLAGGEAVRTAGDGSFELRGLLERRYSICALLQPSLLCVVSNPVDAGDQAVRLVLDRRQLGTIRGRVVARDGRGVGDVRVAVSRERITELVIGTGAVTAADGSFALEGVTREPAFLRLEGEAIVPELFRRLEPDADLANLELTVGRRRRVQFDWGSWAGRDDTLEVVDARGTPLTMMQLLGDGIGEVKSVAYRARVTGVLVVADAAAFAVVYRGGAEIARVRLDLADARLHVVRL